MMFTFQSKGANDIYTIKPGMVDANGTIIDKGTRVTFSAGAFNTSDVRLAYKIMHLDAFLTNRIMLVAIDGEIPNNSAIKKAFSDIGPLSQTLLEKMNDKAVDTSNLKVKIDAVDESKIDKDTTAKKVLGTKKESK